MRRSVRQLTNELQLGLPSPAHDAAMQRDFSSIGQRVRWAIETSGKTLTHIAQAIGCTHATLSLWQNNKTDMRQAKIGLIMAFCTEVNVNLQWLMTGDEPVRGRYAAPEHPLVHAARNIAQEAPALAEQAYRVLRALETNPPAEPKP